MARKRVRLRGRQEGYLKTGVERQVKISERSGTVSGGELQFSFLQSRTNDVGHVCGPVLDINVPIIF